MINPTQQDIQREIDFTRSHLSSLNEYGDGHYNSLSKLLQRDTVLQHYPNIAKDVEVLLNRAREIIKSREELSYELDRKSFPKLDEIVEKIGGYDAVWVMSAMNDDLISHDELQSFMQRRKVLQNSEYREKFLNIGKEIKVIHEDYIKLLKSCAEN